MQLTLHRTDLKPKATLGHLDIDGVTECVTLEDVVRELGPDGSGKIFGETAIPAGNYQVAIDWSAKFQKFMLHILDVKFFTGIRIHSGNTDENTEGCVLVGQEVESDDYIHGGSVALPILQAKVQAALSRGEHVQIKILDEFNCAAVLEDLKEAPAEAQVATDPVEEVPAEPVLAQEGQGAV